MIFFPKNSQQFLPLNCFHKKAPSSIFHRFLNTSLSNSDNFLGTDQEIQKQSPVGVLLKKRFRHRCFPVDFAKFLRALFLHNTSRRLILDFLQIFLVWLLIQRFLQDYIFYLFLLLCSQQLLTIYGYKMLNCCALNIFIDYTEVVNFRSLQIQGKI